MDNDLKELQEHKRLIQKVIAELREYVGVLDEQIDNLIAANKKIEEAKQCQK